MWDLLNQLYKRFGLWSLLFAALAFGFVWGIAHINAQPCEQVSVFFGLIEYKKVCDNGPRNNTICQELQQHFDENVSHQDALKSEIQRLESAESKGDAHARVALEEAFEQLKTLEQGRHEIEQQIERECSNK
ncbi:MAG: hypothetical protein ABIK92_21510 [Pseudomonadota bacterium]